MHRLPFLLLLALTAVGLPVGGIGCVPSAGGGGNTTTERRLSAQISSGSLTAAVNAEDRNDETRLEVSIQGGTPNGMIDITIDGVVVAMVTLDANGSARVQYSSRPDNSAGELPLPAGFSFPGTGDVVSIGNATGQFQDDDDDDNGNDDNGNDDNGNDDNGNDDNGNDDNGNDDNGSDDNGNDDANGNDDDANGNDNDDLPILELKADIAAPTFTARIDYEIESDRVHLRIQVSNGIPGNTVTVDVAGFALEDITLDFSGNADVEYSDQPRAGEVLLPFGFRTLREGDTVSLTGSLAFFVVDES